MKKSSATAICASLLLVGCNTATPAPQLSTTTTGAYQTTTVSTEVTSTGAGNNKITYYVADVRLAKASDIGSIVEPGLTSDVSSRHSVMFSVNGDYFSYRDNGVIMRSGKVLLDEPRRDGMAITEYGEMVVYAESQQTVDFLINSRAVNSFSFGPILVENSVVSPGVDSYYEVDEGRSINGRHPRTGICMIERNHFLFIVVDGRSSGYSRGVTLGEFADLFVDYGCMVAYNLDGGGSSVMYFEGLVVNNPLGKGKERQNGDLIYVSPGVLPG